MVGCVRRILNLFCNYTAISLQLHSHCNVLALELHWTLSKMIDQNAYIYIYIYISVHVRVDNYE